MTDENNSLISSEEYKKVTEELYKQNLEVVRLYKQVESLNKELEMANEGQANLIHIINHQIKGYFSKARNIFAELIEEKDYGAMPAEAKPMLEEGLKSLTEGVDFVQGVLNASNIEKGSLSYVMMPTDLKKLVVDVAEKQRTMIEEKNLAYTISVDEGDYDIDVDPNYMKEAVRNLIDNSFHYTPSGSIELRLSRQDNKILLSIRDTGVGISEEDRPRLFIKGGHGKDSQKINVNSTGFGLSFVKGVIEAHKGRVWVESEGVGKGSTFFVELPLA